LSRVKTLKSLEVVLESFLDRLIRKKGKRLIALDGINRLDDLARDLHPTSDPTEELGQWFARHNRLVSDKVLRAGDHRRISSILDTIRRERGLDESGSPAARKIVDEIDRWSTQAPAGSIPLPASRLVLKRGSEAAATEEAQLDGIAQFDRVLQQLPGLFKDFAGNRQHIMSVLDEALKTAENSNQTAPVMLAATIIYWLRVKKYKVGPFVRRLRKCEQRLTAEKANA